ncbi:cell wall protein [Nocardiopsis sp. NPDC057823]|uniref:cell wall protein n=1 Tax=Nocardiopsis sp. NPDC057823 TaxID=3346256 RepID=UPI00366B9BAD
MKNTKIAARRVIQGGAAFAALGALSIATAMPAAADPVYYGWAYASVADGQGVSTSYDGTSGTQYSGSVGNWLTFSGSNSVTVDDNGVSATSTVDSARLQITVSDVEDIIEENLPEADESGPEADPSADPSAEESAPAEETEGEPTEEPGEGEPTETPAEPETPVETESPVEEAPVEEPPVEEAPAATEDTVTLDESNSENVSGSDEIVLSANISNITTTTTQSWDGEVTHHAPEPVVEEADAVTLSSGEEISVWVGLDSYQGVDSYRDDEYGIDWDDAYTGFALTFTVEGEDAPFYYVDLAESVAAVGVENTENGGGDGEGEGEGEEKPKPTHPNDEKGPEKDPKKVENPEALATTGSPIGGLIAAGAAIAAGGGAAAYLARRKKNAAVEAPAEENDN